MRTNLKSHSRRKETNKNGKEYCLKMIEVRVSCLNMVKLDLLFDDHVVVLLTQSGIVLIVSVDFIVLDDVVILRSASCR